MVFVSMTIEPLVDPSMAGRPCGPQDTWTVLLSGTVWRGGTRRGELLSDFEQEMPKYTRHTWMSGPQTTATDDPHFMADLSSGSGAHRSAAEVGSHPPTPLAPFSWTNAEKEGDAQERPKHGAASEALASSTLLSIRRFPLPPSCIRRFASPVAVRSERGRPVAVLTQRPPRRLRPGRSGAAAV